MPSLKATYGSVSWNLEFIGKRNVKGSQSSGDREHPHIPHIWEVHDVEVIAIKSENLSSEFR